MFIVYFEFCIYIYIIYQFIKGGTGMEGFFVEGGGHRYLS